MNKLHIGLTGGIGSGKSAAAEIFSQIGFYTIDADKLARLAVMQGTPAYKEIVNFFGSGILLPEGDIDRKKLGKIVFSDEEKRKTLENIVHPAIWELERKERGGILGRNSKALIITHAALLIETGSYKKFNPLILIYCPPEEQKRRIMERDGFSEEDALSRINAQMSMEEKIKYAQIIIDNSKDTENLKKEIERAANLIKQLDYAMRHK